MTTSANIYIVAPHAIQTEIQRYFKHSVDDLRQDLGGDVNVTKSGDYLRPELCIDHIKLYYINGDGAGTWRYDIALVAKRYPEAKIYYREMHDDGKSGAVTNDEEKRFFMPYGIMVVNHSLEKHSADADLPAIRRCCSEIWTKQNDGFNSIVEAQNFIDNMHRTFPDLDKWLQDGEIDMWINHFVLEVFDPDTEIAKAAK